MPAVLSKAGRSKPEPRCVWESPGIKGMTTPRKPGAQVHVGKPMLLKMDLKDFFPPVTYARVRGLLIAYGYGYVVAATLAVLMTEALRQPVEVGGTIYHVPVGPRTCGKGAPTSPGLCNALVLRLDRRLGGACEKAWICVHALCG